MEFNDIAMALISELDCHDDIPRAPVFWHAAVIAQQLGEYSLAISYARKGQLEARKAGTVVLEVSCLSQEAKAVATLGNLSYAMELCEAAQDLVVTHGWQSSDKHLFVLSTTAEIAFDQGQYQKSYTIHQSIVQETSPVRAPRFHIHSSLCLVEIDIIMGCEGSQTEKDLDHLKNTSDRLQWNYGLLFADVLMAELRLVQGHKSGEPHLTCFKSARQSNDVQIMFKSLQKLSGSVPRLFDTEDTFHWTVTYFSLARKSKNLWHTYQSLRCLADIYLEWGDRETALSVFQVVLEGFSGMGGGKFEQECREHMLSTSRL
jgi:ATP/maltotriose-dependent transcriptional regulator MalT